MANENQKKKTHAEKKEAKKQRKQERKEQKRAERESHGPDWVDPAQVRPPAIEIREILDWLIAQHKMPHPLVTSDAVMMMWLEAMDTGLAMKRRLRTVMQLWRERGHPLRAYTAEEQELVLSHRAPAMTPPEITVTWQEFKQARDLQRELDEQLTEALQQTVGEKEEGEQEKGVAESGSVPHGPNYGTWEDTYADLSDVDYSEDG